LLRRKNTASQRHIYQSNLTVSLRAAGALSEVKQSPFQRGGLLRRKNTASQRHINQSNLTVLL
jgi:hypothetical protein